ncbi:MAG: hypothetical protein ACRDJL_11575 [Actinomycetota bacterium]
MRPFAVACSALAALLLLTSCSTLTDETLLSRGSEDPRAKDRLLVRTRRGLSVVDPLSGSSVVTRPRAIASPDSSLLFSVSRRGGSAQVTTIDGISGRILRRTQAPSGLEAGVASPDGELLAYALPHEEGTTPWLPAGKRQTTIAVAPTDATDQSIEYYGLKGNFELEGFSTDGEQLFLLQYQPAMNPTRYGLRRLQLDTGRVLRIREEKQKAPGRMRGTGRIAAFSPSGHELYTLYTQQGPNYAHGRTGEHKQGHVYAFVHLLNLEGAWTHCIDLRAPFGTGHVTTHAMTLSPDGERLYVADPSSGGLAVIAPRETRVLRSVTLDLKALTRGAASATVGPDGRLFLGGGSDVLVIDGESLEVLERWDIGRPVAGLAASADGRSLYVGAKNKLSVFDTATGARTGSIRLPRMTELVELIPRA